MTLTRRGRIVFTALFLTPAVLTYFFMPLFPFA